MVSDFESFGGETEIFARRRCVTVPTSWERAIHVFWLLGPFILMIERSPADLWLSVIALVFAGRSIARREGWWLQVAGAFGFLVLGRLPCVRDLIPIASLFTW